MIATITQLALALSSSVELLILTKLTLILAMGLVMAQLAIRARASVRHLLLAATFAALLALPLIVVAVPPVAIVVPISHSSEPIPAPRAAQSSGAPLQTKVNLANETGRWTAPSWPAVVRLAWIAGAVLLLVSLAVDLLRLRRVRRSGLPWTELRVLTQSLAARRGIRRPVEVLLHEEVPAPITCGVRHPAIVFPFDAREWSEPDLRRALIHELEHVRRGDWATQVAARAACAFYWFHPLIWAAWRRLSLEAERACDDAVLVAEENTAYAEQLVSLARRFKAHAQPTLGMANRSDLSARVASVLDGTRRRGRAGLFAAASAMLVAGLVVLAIAPVSAVAQSQRRSAPLDRALLEAADSGDLADMTALLNAGANINGKVSGDGSPLIAAARGGHIAAVRFLLDRGADANLPVSGDGNPLIMAAREGHTAVVMLLLDRGASIDQMVPGDENALIQASASGRLEVVKFLVSRRADVNARSWEPATQGRDGEWRSPLSMARKGRHEAVVAFLLTAGARE